MAIFILRCPLDGGELRCKGEGNYECQECGEYWHAERIGSVVIATGRDGVMVLWGVKEERG